jgi:elongation factor P
MSKASELKRGMVVEIQESRILSKMLMSKVPRLEGQTTLYKVRFNNVKTGYKLDESLKGDDIFKDIDLVRAKVQFSYIDNENYVFMNIEDYSQYSLSKDALDDQIDYLTEGLEGIIALLVDDEILGIELPSVVVLEVIETPPAIKGATASSRTKTAKLSTGAEIQVPEYLESGELIRVNTETGKFSSRA